MKSQAYDVKYSTFTTKAVDYKGVQIIQNALNGGWMLFFSKEGKYPNQPPYAGSLASMKSIINTAIKLGRDGEKQLIQAGTYTNKSEA